MALVNTHQLYLCDQCNCAVQVLMDEDGNRYCGKGKHRIGKPNERI